MFDPRKFRQLFTLSSMFVGFFLTTLSATATSDVVKTEKLKQQGAIILASSDTEKPRSLPLADVQIEELKPRITPIGDGKETSDSGFDSYNNIVRIIQNLPSSRQSRDIRTEDNNIQRLLKQQLNDSLKVYQIIGQLLEEGKLDS